jgi:voltage-gated potassium channel
MRKILILAFVFVLLVIVGTCGFMFLEGMDFSTAIYFTIITMFTVGYGDIFPKQFAGRIFTIFFVMISVSFVFYAFINAVETIIEGELRGVYKRRKMNKEIARLRDHYIVCGFGRIGREICRIFKEHHRPFVVIEKDEEAFRLLEEMGYLRLQGNAADDEILLEAGIQCAKGLVTVVASDADNLFVTLTARELNGNLFIMARSSGGHGVQLKLKRAGATKVISPYSIGARRMAHLIIRPTVADFIDLTMRAGDLDLMMEELQVSTTSQLNGKNLIESEIRKKYDVIVVAIKRQDGTMLFNPRSETVIMARDILIVLGGRDHILGLGKEM